MLNETICHQIALLEEQIFNLQHSGFFTEKQMDAKIHGFQTEIENLQSQVLPLETVLGVSETELQQLTTLLQDCVIRTKTPTQVYGITTQSYNEGTRKHTLYFSKMPSPALLNTWNTLGRNLAISKG